MTRTVSAARVATLVGDFPRSPAYAGLAEALKILIGDGRIGVGVRLPSERSLTGALDVSRTTVTRAYAALGEDGYAEARRGSGTWTRVPDGRSRAHDRSLLPAAGMPGDIDLNCAAPSAPPGLAQAYAAAVEELPAYLGGTGFFPLGVDHLRELVAQRFTDRGLPTSAGQIMITPGALAASSVLAHALARPGDRVVVESPTYPNATQAISSGGARLVPAHVDPDGWDVEAFAATVRQSAARLAYLIPDFQNPTGHLMGDEDRARLAHALRRSHTRPVVDEAHQSLALDDGLAAAMPAPFAVYDPDAITVGSASKSHWGGLRLGWLRAPEPLVDRILHARIGLDLGSPVVDQLALAHLLRDDAATLAHHRTRLRAQRDALVAALAEHLPGWRLRVPRGGLAAWCELPRPGATRLVHAAERLGVIVSPGPMFAVEGGLDRFVRVPWTRPAEELELAVRRLAQAWAHLDAAPDAARPGDAEASPGRVLVA